MKFHTSKPLLTSCGTPPTTHPSSYLAQAIPDCLGVLHATIIWFNFWSSRTCSSWHGIHFLLLCFSSLASNFTTIRPSDFSDLSWGIMTSKNPFIPPFHLQTRWSSVVCPPLLYFAVIVCLIACLYLLNCKPSGNRDCDDFIHCKVSWHRA